MQIDDHVIRISYARKNWDRNNPSLDQDGTEQFHGNLKPPGTHQVSPNIALEQAQWAMQQRQPAASNPATQVINAQLGQPPHGDHTSNAPGPGYVLDESSGYLYNTLTGIYY